MACELTITDLVGVAGPYDYDVLVRGTSQECSSPSGPDQPEGTIRIRVSCSGPEGPFATAYADPGPDGRWEAAAYTGCGCEGPLFVTAECLTVPGCGVATLEVTEPECVACPSIRYGAGEINPPPEVICNEDGTTSVYFSVQLFNQTGQAFLMRATAEPPGAVATGTLFVNIPQGQTVVPITYVHPRTDRAVVRTVRFEFVESLVSTDPIPCQGLLVSFVVGPCGCPGTAEVVVNSLTCVSDTPAVGVFTAVPDQQTASGICESLSYEWEFGDGSPAQLGGPTIQHEYSNPGIYPVVVLTSCDECVTSAATVVEVGSCGGSSSTCTGFEIGYAATLAMTFIALALIPCFPAAAKALIAIAAVTLVLAVAAALFLRDRCEDECHPLKRGLGRALLTSGVLLASFSGCCSALLGIGLALIAGGLAAIWYWAKQCKPHSTFCAFAKEVTLAVTVTAAPILGALLFVPALSECYQRMVFGAIGLGLAPFAWKAVTCNVVDAVETGSDSPTD
jgi:PKD domain